MTREAEVGVCVGNSSRVSCCETLELEGMKSSSMREPPNGVTAQVQDCLAEKRI